MSEQINSPNYVVCHCQHCDGHIEFDANQLTEENSIIPCPHCSLETKLLIPQKATAPAFVEPPVVRREGFFCGSTPPLEISPPPKPEIPEWMQAAIDEMCNDEINESASSASKKPRAIQNRSRADFEQETVSISKVSNFEAPVVFSHKLGLGSNGTKVVIAPPQSELPDGKELIGLLLEIEQNGFVTEDGLHKLYQWLNTKLDSKIRAIPYLFNLLSKILGCGKLTMDNRYEMQLAIERVLPKDIRNQVKIKRYQIERQLPASETTLANIQKLGGNPHPEMTRTEAFQMESDLSSPATENQIAYIRRLGGNPSPEISFQAASDLINKLLHSTKATSKQIQFIRDLGGNPPTGLSRADAEILIPQLLEKQRTSLAREQPPTPRQMMVLRFWNKTDLMQSSKWEVEQWLTKFYDEDSRRREAWELFKTETGDDGSQHDPSFVPLGSGENYLKRVS